MMPKGLFFQGLNEKLFIIFTNLEKNVNDLLLRLRRNTQKRFVLLFQQAKKIKKYISKVSRRISLLVDDILDLQKIEAGKAQFYKQDIKFSTRIWGARKITRTGLSLSIVRQMNKEPAIKPGYKRLENSGYFLFRITNIARKVLNCLLI
jgi:hypothetical protein